MGRGLCVFASCWVLAVGVAGLGACGDEQTPPPIQPSGPGDPGDDPVLEPAGGGPDDGIFTGATGAGVGGASVAPGFGQGGAETGLGGFAEDAYF